AAEMQAPIHFADQVRIVTDWNFRKHELIAEVTTLHTDTKHQYALDLTGIYQSKNLVTSLESIHQLQQQGWKIDEQHVLKGLSRVKKKTGLHGRWEIMHDDPLVVLDVGHNEEGIQQIAR